ncbi:MAG: radical SAM protein [Desulfuromonadales bacterium]|nr:radical SAM protein [Desulfuromonadales bacterium]
MSTDILLIQPPATKAVEPPLGLAILAGTLRAQGFSVATLDANLSATLALLAPESAARAAGAEPPTNVRRALKQATASLALVRSTAALTSFPRYATALHHLHTLLGLYGGKGERLTLGDYEYEAFSPFAPAALKQLAAGSVTTLFHQHFAGEIVPAVLSRAPRIIAFSINYRHQLLPAFELAGMLRRALPSAILVAGGGMITSWQRVLSAGEIHLPLFDHLIFGPGEEPLARLAGGGAHDYLLIGTEIAFSPDFSELPLHDYLSPRPVLPIATSRGCYWGKCRFCPEAAAPTHPYRSGAAVGFPDRLLALAARTGVRDFHLTDNAIPVPTLKALADRQAELHDIRWHGFVRFERALLDPALVAGLAKSGCTLLQLGLESGSQAVLEQMDKGTKLTEAAQILESLRVAGIASYVYVMTGIPGETAADAALTRRFLLDHAEKIGFLNLALMNLPRDASLLEQAGDYAIASADLLDSTTPLGLYRSFSSSTDWGRNEARRFLAELKREPAIRAILQRTPPWLTSNHAFFFPPPARVC